MYVITLMGKDPKIGGHANYERLYFEQHRYYPNTFTSSLEKAEKFDDVDQCYRILSSVKDGVSGGYFKEALNNLDYDPKSIEIRKLMLKPGKTMEKIELDKDYSFVYSNEWIHRNDAALLELEKEQEKLKNNSNYLTS